MPSPRSHFGNGTSYKLARRRGNIELDVQSSEKGHGRESLQSPIILLYSVVAIVIIYAITHHDYTQYIYTVWRKTLEGDICGKIWYTCNRGQAHSTMLVASV